MNRGLPCHEVARGGGAPEPQTFVPGALEASSAWISILVGGRLLSFAAANITEVASHQQLQECMAPVGKLLVSYTIVKLSEKIVVLVFDLCR